MAPLSLKKKKTNRNLPAKMVSQKKKHSYNLKSWSNKTNGYSLMTHRIANWSFNRSLFHFTLTADVVECEKKVMLIA